MLWSGPASLLIVVFTGRWMARRSLAPLGRLAAEARAIDVSELDRRLPVRGAGDELDEVAVAFNDTLKRLERSVGEMKQWSAAMAHELRTPLAALRGETELALAETGSPERIEQRLVSQLEELDRLTRLVNQLLTLANAEAGEISLAHERVDLPALVRSVVDQLVPMADARDVSLVCGQLEPATVRGDRGWLERLLLNLLDNAIKFNRCSGSIDVSLRSTTSETRLEVTDTGVGIDEAALPHLFEPFYRADPSRSSRVEGAGVGLALAKWIVERHGGRIEVDSAVGHGSHFTVTLPIDRET
jgi:heavy metal sensor kinase